MVNGNSKWSISIDFEWKMNLAQKCAFHKMIEKCWHRPTNNSFSREKSEHRIETLYNVNGVNRVGVQTKLANEKKELITILSQYQYRIPSTGKNTIKTKMRKWVKRKAMCLHKYLRGYQVRYSVEMWCGKWWENKERTE